MQKRIFGVTLTKNVPNDDVEDYGCADEYNSLERIQNDFSTEGYAFAIVDPSKFSWFRIETTTKKIPLKEKKVAPKGKKAK